MDPLRLAKFREGKGKSQGGYNQNDLRQLMHRTGLLTRPQADIQLSRPLILHILDGGSFPVNSTERKKWGLGTGEFADGHFDLLTPAEQVFRRNGGKRERNVEDVAEHMGKQEDVMKQVATRGRRTNLISTLIALRESKGAGDAARASHQLKKDAKAKIPKPQARTEQDVADHMVRQEHVMNHLKDPSAYKRGVRAGVWLATNKLY